MILYKNNSIILYNKSVFYLFIELGSASRGIIILLINRGRGRGGYSNSRRREFILNRGLVCNFENNKLRIRHVGSFVSALDVNLLLFIGRKYLG